MGIEVYLGEPPKHIKDWIINHSVKLETHIKFVNGTEGDYLIEGVMDCPALVAAGLMPEGSGSDVPVTWINEPVEVKIGSAVTSIGYSVFTSCENLTNVAIPDSVKIIGNYAFYNCSRLTGVTIPDSVTSIGEGAFQSCRNFESMTIPNSVTEIQYIAFDGCTMLRNVTFSGKDKATVQAMANHYWGLNSGCVLHCTDGDITI